MNQLLYDRLHISLEAIADFSQQHQTVELALFGSVLQDDFRSDRDVDALVTFVPDAKISRFDHTEFVILACEHSSGQERSPEC